MAGSRPDGGRGAVLGMLTEVFPSLISIIQSKWSYPEDQDLILKTTGLLLSKNFFCLFFDQLPARSYQT